MFEANDSIVIGTFTPQCLGADLRGVGLSVNNYAAAVWPANDTAIFLPFNIIQPCIVTKLFTYNGTVNGSIDLGIYTWDGTLIVSANSSGLSLTQTGSNVIQSFDITDTLIGPGNYHLAMAGHSAGTLPAVRRLAPAVAGIVSALGVVEMTSAYTLPATATFASASAAYIPYLYLTARVVI